MLNVTSRADAREEQKLFDDLCAKVDRKESLIFNAGAGAGKTYALVECLKHICINHGKRLKKNNQHVICITYTNVAANEIKERLGNNSIVKVSTIHERIWDFISDYQKELVMIHQEFLQEQIALLEKKIVDEKYFIKYRELTEEQKKDFLSIMIQNKDEYYKAYDLRAAEFRSCIISFAATYSSLLGNVGDFKKIVNSLFTLDNYQRCIVSITKGEKGFQSVTYDPLNNKDRLHRMKISHRTLLTYGYRMIKKYDLLKRVLIDKYPFFLIDEYQDTSDVVIEIMQLLHLYSIEIGHPLFVGYFGDSVQNIYDEGVGDRITDYHLDFVVLNKKYNRRSCQEVIDVANRVRKDAIDQKSIFEDCYGGKVRFCRGEADNIGKIIEDKAIAYSCSEQDPLHCFMLTNKSVAHFAGFDELYRSFSASPYYKKNYDELNTELLSQDLTKLGTVPLFLYKLLSLVFLSKDEKTLITELIPRIIYQDICIDRLKQMVDSLKSIAGNNLEEIISSLVNTCETTKDDNFRKLIKYTLDLSDISEMSIRRYIVAGLYEESEFPLEDYEIFYVESSQWKSWFDYVLGKKNSAVQYHTYHGTKGLEFGHVIIIMENKFGKEKDFFNHYFALYGKDNIDEKYIKARNLLYVSITRAIDTLDIIYTDDLTGLEDSLYQIFGKENCVLQ